MTARKTRVTVSDREERVDGDAVDFTLVTRSERVGFAEGRPRTTTLRRDQLSWHFTAGQVTVSGFQGEGVATWRSKLTSAQAREAALALDPSLVELVRRAEGLEVPSQPVEPVLQPLALGGVHAPADLVYRLTCECLGVDPKEPPDPRPVAWCPSWPWFELTVELQDAAVREVAVNDGGHTSCLRLLHHRLWWYTQSDGCSGMPVLWRSAQVLLTVLSSVHTTSWFVTALHVELQRVRHSDQGGAT